MGAPGGRRTDFQSGDDDDINGTRVAPFFGREPAENGARETPRELF